ncbi:MAG: response regulator [Spirochaetaceae bacterium]|nr:MAG: response regulator [Spirochaetaceae bacterium]
MKNVLIVDDDRVVLSSCKRILESEGYATSLTSNVNQALQILKEKNFDLILVDVIMPEYDGIYLIGNVRQMLPDLPILVMSGYPTPETISSGLRMGATHFIAKPFTPDELIDAVHKALGEPKGK